MQVYIYKLNNSNRLLPYIAIINKSYIVELLATIVNKNCLETNVPKVGLYPLRYCSI